MEGAGEYTLEIRRSVFITTLSHIESAEEAEVVVRAVRKKYSDATHNCYAYIADESGLEARFSDDGEPGGTAGQPMLEVLKKQGLRKVVAVVTRYFGGIKLGAGGLVAAYTDSVAEAVRQAGAVRLTECAAISLSASYADFPATESALARAGFPCGRKEYGEEVAAVFYAPVGREDEALETVLASSGGKIRGRVTGIEFRALREPDR